MCQIVATFASGFAIHTDGNFSDIPDDRLAPGKNTAAVEQKTTRFDWKFRPQLNWSLSCLVTCTYSKSNYNRLSVVIPWIIRRSHQRKPGAIRYHQNDSVAYAWIYKGENSVFHVGEFRRGWGFNFAERNFIKLYLLPIRGSPILYDSEYLNKAISKRCVNFLKLLHCT